MNSIRKLNSLQISLLIFLGVIAFACMLTSVIFVGIKAYPLIFSATPVLNTGEQPTANILSAKDVFFVTAVDAAHEKGYTVTSAVCEVVSPERFRPTFNVNSTPTTIDVEAIVFHAFRITDPTLHKEVAVVFESNHTAADGKGIIATVNPDAKRLFPNIIDGSTLTYPITMNTAGAQSALECAQQAGKPPSLDLGGFDYETWRQEAIQKFGAEQTYSDGSKQDYVYIALTICRESSTDRETMIANLGANYQGSLQQFIIDTFCPHVINP